MSWRMQPPSHNLGSAMIDLQGRVALVTGASRGIGAATARALARAGADVVVHFRRESSAAEAVAADVQRLGRRAVLVQADLRDRSSAQADAERCGGGGRF